MKTTSTFTAVLLSICAFAASEARATLIYDNGPINGHSDAHEISQASTISDSFTSSGPASLTSVQVGLWMVFPGDMPLTIDWSIGTSPFASNIDSGTSTFTNTFLFTNFLGADVYQSTLNISGLIGAGTFYLTLGNGTDSFGTDFVFWDENNGPSMAFSSLIGSIPSESFQVFGTSGPAVPDAGSTAMLLGIAMAGMGWLRRKICA